MIRKAPSYFCFAFVFVCCVAVISSPASADGIILQGTAGLTLSPGEVGDDLTGGGFMVGGRVGFALNPRFTFFGGGHLSFLRGQDVGGVTFTENAFVFDVEGGATFYLLDGAISDTRPFVGAAIGFGALAWAYSDAAQIAGGVAGIPIDDSDAIGFVYVAPEAGVEFGLGENLALGVGTRFMFTSYSDTTGDDFIWDFSDGHFWMLFGTLTVEL